MTSMRGYVNGYVNESRTKRNGRKKMNGNGNENAQINLPAKILDIC